MTTLSDAISACSFHFTPVRVSRGRKFKGFAYDLGVEYSHAVAYNVMSYSTKMWDPSTKSFVYANPDFCVKDNSITDEEINAAKLEYVKSTIESTIAWCKSKSPNEAEAMKFARNVLRKHHPEMIACIDVYLPDNRDVVSEIEKTLQWAANLKTRECWMYGKHCPGGKPLSNERKVTIALKALTKRGVTVLNGFHEVWELTLTTMGLPLIFELPRQSDEVA